MLTALLASLAIVDARSRLDSFIELAAKWNRRINVSGADSRDALEEHVVDSLHVVPWLRDLDRVLDVGAGGGFPSVVAAICLPTVEVTALEPVHKKHAFLRTAARELGLSNLVPHAERLEDHSHHDYAAAMSRATFDLREWLLMGAKYVRPGGRVIGFEALARADLPANVERDAYRLGSKTRSLVVYVPRGTSQTDIEH
jgi:16S rRNA (guanine527-N7)-methyltransferase